MKKKPEETKGEPFQESSKLPSCTTVESSSVKEKIKAFNLGNSPNVAHVSKTQARNIKVVSGTFNQSNAAHKASVPPLTSSTPIPVASVSNTTVTGDLHVSSTVTNIQPVASVTNTQVTGDLYVKSTVKMVNQMGPDWPLAEKKFDREIPAPLKALYDAYQTRCDNPELVQALEYYVSSEATYLLGSEKRLNLEMEVKQFLTSEHASLPLLLIQGDSGSGKSLYANLLEQRLWQDYDPKQVESLIPVFVELKSIESSAPQDFIQHVLERRYGYTVQQIQQLRDQSCFVFILDGYDEMSGEARSVYLDNELNKWDAKVIVTCRTQYLNSLSSYQHLFATTQNVTIASSSFKEIFVAPFNTNQIEAYLENYTKNQKTEWDAKKYLEKLHSFLGVREFIQSPLLLEIVIGLLSKLEKLQSQQNNRRITRADIYELSIRKWFERENFHAAVKSSDPYGLFGEFSERLAFKMFLEGVIEVDYKPSGRSQSESKEWEQFFFNSEDPKIVRRRAGCPLRRIGEGRYSFYHKSFMEYFCAMHLYEEWGLGESNDERFKKTLGNLANTDLNKKLLTHEPAIIEFLSEKIKGNEISIERLLSIVMASKKNPAVSNAAANAITIAKVACLPRSPFSGKDFSYVQIAGADLSYGIYDHTNFSYANLKGVDFTQAWLGNANLSYCQMQNVQFGELVSPTGKFPVYSMTLSHDRRYLAMSSNEDIGIIVWDFLTGEQLYCLKEESGYDLTFSPDGQMLAWQNWQSRGKGIRLWNIGDQSGYYRILQGDIRCISFNSNSKILISGEDKVIKLWDLENLEKRTLEGHTDVVNSVCISPDGKIIASGSKDKTIRLWDFESDISRIVLDGHTGSVERICFSPDGRTIASASDDKTVRVWNIKTITYCILQHSATIQCVNFSPDGQLLASGSNRTLRLWDVKSGVCHALLELTDLIKEVGFNHDGQILITRVGIKVELWSVRSIMNRNYLYSSIHSRVYDLFFNPDGQTLASYGDSTIALWNIKSGSCYRILENCFPMYDDPLYPQSIAVYYLNDKRREKLWDLAPDEVLNSITRSSSSCSPEKIPASVKDKSVELWDMETKASRYLEGHKDKIECISFSPDNQTLVSGSKDKTVRLWDVKKGITSLVLEGHTGAIQSVSFSADGQTLASSDSDEHSVRLWNVKNGQCIVILKGYLKDVESTCFYGDDYLATGSHDGAVKLWRQVNTSSGKVWQLQWSSSRPTLFCENCYIDGAQGLSSNNYELLQQRGAVAVTSFWQKTQDLFAYYTPSFFGSSPKDAEKISQKSNQPNRIESRKGESEETIDSLEDKNKTDEESSFRP